MVSIAFKSLKRIINRILLVGGSVVWLSSLLLLAQTVENTGDFERLHNWILLLNAVGVVLLLVLNSGNIYRLVRDYQKHVLGSRLKARLVSMFVLLAVVPLLLVYYFSVQFLNRGIDSWFQLEVDDPEIDAVARSNQQFPPLSLTIHMEIVAAPKQDRI